MPDELNLESGDPARGDSAAERRRRRRQQTTDAKAESPKVAEGEVRMQLSRAFDGIAKSRDARGDEELADAVREEADAMTEGFVTLTNSVTALRMPIVILLNLIITLLAFGRVGGILIGRLAARRAARMVEQEAETQAFEPSEYGVQ